MLYTITTDTGGLVLWFPGDMKALAGWLPKSGLPVSGKVSVLPVPQPPDNTPAVIYQHGLGGAAPVVQPEAAPAGKIPETPVAPKGEPVPLKVNLGGSGAFGDDGAGAF